MKCEIKEPFLHGKPLSEWKRLGLFTMKEIMEYHARQMELPFDEDRIDIIGANGNDGLHYKTSPREATKEEKDGKV